MALRLFVLPEYPDQFAATKIDCFIRHGVFFLDFSRPLKPLRKPGVLNRWFGSPIGLLVPLVHQGEETGEFVTGIHCSDPCFADLIALWKVRYRSRRTPPAQEDDADKIIADFSEQFPEDCLFLTPAPATRHNRGPTVQSAPITRGR
jgi:hypothetical protein